jgi:hypothetical protein
VVGGPLLCLLPGCVQKIVFVAAGFSLRCLNETPVPQKVAREIFDWPQTRYQRRPP